MMMDGMTGMWVVMLFWGLFGLALLTLAVLAIVWLVGNLRRNGGNAVIGRDDAEQVLRREYASGRIDHDEYQHRRANLGL